MSARKTKQPVAVVCHDGKRCKGTHPLICRDHGCGILAGRAAAADSDKARAGRKPAFDCSAWVCEAPPATPESEGWWWVVDVLENEDRALPADVTLHNGDLHVRVFGWEYSVLVNRCGLRWGGRLAVNGASQTPSSGTLTTNHEKTMQTENDTPKPEDSPKQVTGEGCPEAPCWAISGDEENYWGGESTKEAAIAEGRCLYPDSPFWVGRCVKPTQPEDFWRAEDWLEHVACQDEYSTDWAEGWDSAITREQMQELESSVRKIMGDWLDRHKHRPAFYGIEDAEKIQPNRPSSTTRGGNRMTDDIPEQPVAGRLDYPGIELGSVTIDLDTGEIVEPVGSAADDSRKSSSEDEDRVRLQRVGMPREQEPRVAEASDAVGGGGVGGVEQLAKESGLELCGVGGECNRCEDPHGRTWADVCRGQDFEEVSEYVCEKCIPAYHAEYLREVAFWDEYAEHEIRRLEAEAGGRDSASERNGAQGHTVRISDAPTETSR